MQIPPWGQSHMRVSNSAHEAQPWVIHEIAHDFKLLDVWALPAEGGREDFDSLLEGLSSADPTQSDSAVVRFLFWVRLRIGDLLGWDEAGEPRPIPGCSETTLRDRLPESLRESATESQISDTMQRIAGGFAPL